MEWTMPTVPVPLTLTAVTGPEFATLNSAQTCNSYNTILSNAMLEDIHPAQWKGLLDCLAVQHLDLDSGHWMKI